jgi:HAD superfamily hydrolase (TIGR01509 family)
MFLQMVDDDGVAAFPGAAEALDWLGVQAIPTAVVSSSQNAEVVLRAATLRHKVDMVVDGVVALRQGLAGKPQPDTYLYAAAQLGANPSRTVVVEDACSGVRAGQAGGFWVVGIDRGAGRDELLRNGADVVIDELDELLAYDRVPTPSAD